MSLSAVIFMLLTLLNGVGLIVFVQVTNWGFFGVVLYMILTGVVYWVGQNLWQRKWQKHHK